MTPLGWFIALVIVGVSLGGSWMLIRDIHRIAPPGRNLLDPPTPRFICPSCDREAGAPYGRDAKDWYVECECGKKWTQTRAFDKTA